MKETPYSKFNSDDLILRDELAIDRTLLANERTLLAYIRSGLALLLAGASIIHFAPHGWFWVIGLVCVPLGVLSGIIGVLRYRKMNSAILSLRSQSDERARQTGGRGVSP